MLTPEIQSKIARLKELEIAYADKGTDLRRALQASQDASNKVRTLNSEHKALKIEMETLAAEVEPVLEAIRAKQAEEQAAANVKAREEAKAANAEQAAAQVKAAQDAQAADRARLVEEVAAAVAAKLKG